MQERLQAATDRLAAIEQDRETLLGEAGLAKQAIADYDKYLDRLQAEMTAARIEEAETAFQQAISGRDAALEQASVAVMEVATAIERVEAARKAVETASRELRSLSSKAVNAPPEPTDFADRWRAIAPLLEQELGRRLETELVEAAARSTNPLMLRSLPEHLQQFALQRRGDYASAARQRRPK
jgi:chromosome segregation ATPase